MYISIPNYLFAAGGCCAHRSRKVFKSGGSPLLFSPPLPSPSLSLPLLPLPFPLPPPLSSLPLPFLPPLPLEVGPLKSS